MPWIQRRVVGESVDWPEIDTLASALTVRYVAQPEMSVSISGQLHAENLHKVFGKLQECGLRVNKEKCVFFADSINYLGHVISKEGVSTCPRKVEAILNTPAPSNISELKSFIGLVMYYAKFIPNISTTLAPLYRLLKSGVKYVWNGNCEEAFKRVKSFLISGEVLTHYSLDLPLILTTDASSVGVGAVISHIMPNGLERPVAYASRSLQPAEKNYAQIDREALAIIFGIRKFHQYLYGRKFVLRTDHKPLTFIFGQKVGIPVMAASRLQRWAVLLSGYSYEIEYVPSAKNCADALSRLPQMKAKRATIKETTYLHFVENFLPITHHNVRTATSKDITMSRVLSYIISGWPSTCPTDELKPYFIRRNELYAEGGCIMWGYRMVIPGCLRPTILKQLHVSHMGIVKTKAIARSYVWWPSLDSNIESTCKSCETCAAEADAPPRTLPKPWPYIPQPWSRLHMDFLGPYNGKTFFVLVDSTSKWIEVFEMARTTASCVIRVLRSVFARFGLPVELVSDQGPPFTSTEMADFLQKNGIRQSFSPVFHPASNGAAENAVKLCKKAIKKSIRDKVDLHAALHAFLMTYRNTPHCTTGETPAMMLLRRSLRTRLDLLRYDHTVTNNVHRNQNRQVAQSGGVHRKFEVGEPVWAQGFGRQDKWVKAIVQQKEGSRRYVLDDSEGKLFERHTDQLKHRLGSSIPQVPSQSTSDSVQGNKENFIQNDSASDITPEQDDLSAEGIEVVPNVNPNEVTVPPTDRPKRVRKTVKRFGFELD